MRGIGHTGDGKSAVVAGDADAGSGYELADDETMNSGGLNGGSGGSRGASAGSGESRSASDVRELRRRGNGDDGERAVVAGNADASNGDGLPCREAVRGAGGDGNEKTVF